jgi:predicted AAA+ superfamily ATPase
MRAARGKRDYLERIVRGGFPEALRRSPRRRAAFFDSYLTILIERDVKEITAIDRRGELRRLLVLLAGRSASLLVPTALANESGIPRTTLNRSLELLAAVFLIKQIPAWSTSQNSTRHRQPRNSPSPTPESPAT